LIIGDFNWPLMSEIQNVQKFLEVLILKGLRSDISPPQSTLPRAWKC
jgi:hypothetical protein